MHFSKLFVKKKKKNLDVLAADLCNCNSIRNSINWAPQITQWDLERKLGQTGQTLPACSLTTKSSKATCILLNTSSLISSCLHAATTDYKPQCNVRIYIYIYIHTYIYIYIYIYMYCTHGSAIWYILHLCWLLSAHATSAMNYSARRSSNTIKLPSWTLQMTSFSFSGILRQEGLTKIAISLYPPFDSAW